MKLAVDKYIMVGISIMQCITQAGFNQIIADMC